MTIDADEVKRPALRQWWAAVRAWRLRQWVSPLTSRLLLVNFLPLLFMGGMLLSINAVRNTLLHESVEALREQARLYASALHQAEIPPTGTQHKEVTLNIDAAHLLLTDMIAFSRNVQVRLYAPNGRILTESNKGPNEVDGIRWQPTVSMADRVYSWVLALVPLDAVKGRGPFDKAALSVTLGRDVGEDVHLSSQEELPPYIRLTAQHDLVLTVVEPVIIRGQTVGVLQLTRYHTDIDRALMKVRWVIIVMMLLSMVCAALLSWYFAMTLSRPLRRLVVRSREMREPGQGRVDGLPYALLGRRDEIGELARTLRESALALWARMDDIERFASEASHELKNPLSSIRAALDTLLHIREPQARERLVEIVRGDVKRLERLISDISSASRVEGDLQRGQWQVVSIISLIEIFVELHETIRKDSDVHLVASLPEIDEGLYVLVVEDRLVQVLHNLIGNAVSFSPTKGTIRLIVRPITGPPRVAGNGEVIEGGPAVEICVEDEGPGIPAAKLDSIFERFYSERPEGEHFGQHSGLGLAISRQIILAFDGHLYAENREQRDAIAGATHICGARFVIRLPRVSAEGVRLSSN